MLQASIPRQGVGIAVGIAIGVGATQNRPRKQDG